MKPAFFEDPKYSSNILNRTIFESKGATCRPKGSPIYPFESLTNAQRKQDFQKNCDAEKVVFPPGTSPTRTPPFFNEKSPRKFLRYKNHRVLLRLPRLMAPWPCHGIGRLKLLTKLRHFPDRREVSSLQHATHQTSWSHPSPIRLQAETTPMSFRNLWNEDTGVIFID